jgi:arsenate reductase
MAEGFAREYAREILEVYSAGTDPSPEVKLNAVKAMDEVGIDISDQYPKLLEEILSELDVLITMGCGVECPYIPCEFREDWRLDDPAGYPMEVFREAREIIDGKVEDLIKKIKNEEI